MLLELKTKMKIVYLITGSGGSFYCGNCYRDMIYLRAIRKVPGISATGIPLYLPPDKASSGNTFDDEVFFGAISMYLREKVSFLSNMPIFLEKFFDSGPFLKIASRMAGTTRTEGLEDLTLNMIEGDNAFRKDEIDRLVKYLIKDGKPDIIHLSNALILGLARQLKNRINIRIVCSLLNEDDWVDDMKEPYRGKAWEMIAKEAVYVNRFITPSNYYKELFLKRTGLKGDNINVIPLGIDPGNFPARDVKQQPPAIGYFCRISHHNGFDKLVDAFIKLKADNLIPDLSLNVCGGYTGDDKPFIAEQIKKIRRNGFHKSVRIYPEFDGFKKAEFFRDVDLISVPVRKYDGYGLYILEANSAGVPVVQPATGAFPEIVRTTGGGITYSPDTIEKLALSLADMLNDQDLRIRLGKSGQDSVRRDFSLDKMSEGLSHVYTTL